MWLKIKLEVQTKCDMLKNFPISEEILACILWCSCLVTKSCLTLWLHGLHQASLSFTTSQSLPKFMSTESAMPSNHLIFCCPLLLLPSIFPSIRVFPKEVAICIRWPKYWSFTFSISPSNEYSGLISSRIDWFHPLAIQGTLKSLLQYRENKIGHCFPLFLQFFAMKWWTGCHDIFECWVLSKWWVRSEYI